MNAAFDDYYSKVMALVGGCALKEPEELTELEKLALYLASGGEQEWSGSGYRAKYPFAIQKINGVFRVCISVA